MEVREQIAFHEHGTEGDYTITKVAQQDISQIKRDNWTQAEQSNGFSDGRTMRKVASIPVVEYLNALKLGYDLDCTDNYHRGRELNRYLSERGKSMGTQTVKNILTPGGHANIIIK